MLWYQKWVFVLLIMRLGNERQQEILMSLWNKYALLDSATVAFEKLTLSDLPPVLRELQEHHTQECKAVCSSCPLGKTCAAGPCYTYSEQERKELEKQMRAKGLL